MAVPPKLLIQTAQFVWNTLWHTMMSQLAPSQKSGEYQRPSSEFRHAIGDNHYPPDKNRYRLYVGLTCPWAHRTVITRLLKGLEETIDLQVAIADVTAGGWRLEGDDTGCQSMKALYQLAKPGYTGRCTVPVLWDCQTQTIVNNESSEIIVMLNDAFKAFARFPERDLYPSEHRAEIDRLNDHIYTTINNGVYRCGFAQSQTAYDQAVTALFATLDELEQILGDRRYLCGDQITLADVRLFTTLIRFDLVYHGLFKCNRQRIRDYTNLWGYLRDIYQQNGIASTCALESIKQEYYSSLFPLNPGGIVPIGIDLASFNLPHNRHQLTSVSL